MSRIRTLLPAALLLGGCTAPGLKYIDGFDQTTGDSDASTSGSSSEAESTSIMTSTEGSDSSDASHSGTTTTTTDAGTGTTTTTTADTTTSTGGEAFCGDGLVEGDEECDDANDIADDRCFECTKNRWVFASAALHKYGDLGGVEGADSLCRQYALQSGKADDSWKTFIAWLSDADHDVRDRLYPGRGRYVRTDGVVVAETVDRFFSGSIAAPINVDEHGNQDIPGGVLTGTRPDGTAAPGTHCDNWTTKKITDFSAYKGGTSGTDGSWTMYPNPDVNPQSCGVLNARLYCIEGE